MSTQLSLAATLVLALAAGAALGAPPTIPNDATLERAAATETKRAKTAIDQAARQAPLLQQRMPDIVNPMPTTKADPSAIAARYANVGKQSAPATLLIMVSYSMPPEAIARLASMASQVGATLVLRGMVDNSMEKTASVSAEFIKRYPNLQIQIDPTVFRRFEVTQVPTFVLTRSTGEDKSCTKGCDPADSFVSVVGDVSLDYALEYITRNGGDTFAPIAEQQLQKLRSKP
ncbi:type-F conjugative transfer system pilin assembly protein TrbC [Rhodoferax sp.]|uniref:type-F conjugative transfer system pilin assembly protein TrbC n=1 Tax=Rhodoferax sp. TaxID=50421 RepID=UPI00276D6D11|nr:type-F conjugative transfer system pilin assembly protein TrbC [Rhodoferax sp.]